MIEYKIPLQLLDCEVESAGTVDEEIEENKQKLLNTLKGLGVDGEIQSFSVGPSFITYNVTVLKTITFRKIRDYKDDISFGTGKRVRCYVDEKNNVFCVEIPRKNCEVIRLGQMIKEDRLTSTKDGLTVFFGKDGKNQSVTYELNKLVNMLIVGEGYLGRDAFLNTLITSLIYNNSPKNLRLVLFNAENAAFEKFCGLPHLMFGPVGDSTEILNSLNRIADEMEKRYVLLKNLNENGHRVYDIYEYNRIVGEKQKLPSIVVVIDGVKDMTGSFGDKLRTVIMRLTQKARAAGIYIIVSAQRLATFGPSLINNFPTRIAFRTAYQEDSRIAIMCPDAENLSAGEFLYLTKGQNDVKRVLSPVVSVEEVGRVVGYIKNHYEADNDVETEKNIPDNDSVKEEAAKGVDPCYVEALKAIIEVGRASISIIQRKCNIGFNKATLIIEWMEKNHYISELGDQRCRKVLISMDEFENKFRKGFCKMSNNMGNNEFFESKCMDIIEVITSIKETNTRQDAIRIAQKLKNKLLENPNIDISVYSRVIREFEIATDEEYELLKEQIFKRSN